MPTIIMPQKKTIIMPNGKITSILKSYILLNNEFPIGIIFDVKFNGNPNDSGTNAYTGTANGSPSYTIGQDGISNHAIGLVSASSQSIQFTSSTIGTTFDWGSSGSFSVSIWVKISGFNENTRAVGRVGAFGEGWVIIISGTSIRAEVADGSFAVDSDTDSTVADGLWHNYLMVVDRAGQLLTFYKDGSIFGSAKNIITVGSLTPVFATDLFFGQSGGGFLDGILDEGIIWNRALSSTEAAIVFSIGAR